MNSLLKKVVFFLLTIVLSAEAGSFDRTAALLRAMQDVAKKTFGPWIGQVTSYSLDKSQGVRYVEFLRDRQFSGTAKGVVNGIPIELETQYYDNDTWASYLTGERQARPLIPKQYFTDRLYIDGFPGYMDAVEAQVLEVEKSWYKTAFESLDKKLITKYEKQIRDMLNLEIENISERILDKEYSGVADDLHILFRSGGASGVQTTTLSEYELLKSKVYARMGRDARGYELNTIERVKETDLEYDTAFRKVDNEMLGDYLELAETAKKMRGFSSDAKALLKLLGERKSLQQVVCLLNTKSAKKK